MSLDVKCCNTNTEDCKNPLILLIEKAQTLVTVDLTISEAVLSVLTNGLFITHSGNICCPDCDARMGYYFLGGISPLTDVADEMSQIPGSEGSVRYPCCINHSFNGLNAAAYETVFGAMQPPCCNNDFTEVISSTILSATVLSNLVEASGFNQSSGLGILLQYLTLEGFTSTDINLILETIINEGLVIKCKECEIFIGSSTAYILRGSVLGLIP